MITGAHHILYTTDAAADRDFLANVLGFRSVDAGGGWLIFALPPGEVAVHPDQQNGRVEFYLLCDDIDAQLRELRAQDVACAEISDQRWGRLSYLTLPSGAQLGIYEPRHPTAI